MTSMLQLIYNWLVANNVRRGILCQPRQEPTGTADAPTIVVAKRPKREQQIVPISNLPPSRRAENTEFPGPQDFRIYALQRDLDALRQDRTALLTKLTRCLETLVSELRFLEVGLHYNQWETYGELEQRVSRLKGMIALIQDPVALIQNKTSWSVNDR